MNDRGVPQIWRTVKYASLQAPQRCRLIVTVTTHSLFAWAYEEGFAVSGHAINLTECHRHGARASAEGSGAQTGPPRGLALLSRYSTQHVTELGKYTLNLAREPGPWLSEPTFRQAIQLVRRQTTAHACREGETR